MRRKPLLDRACIYEPAVVGRGDAAAQEDAFRQLYEQAENPALNCCNNFSL
jgi:hypothetical protein